MSAHFATRTVHTAGADPGGSRPTTAPLYQGHQFRFDSAERLAAAFGDQRGDFFYGRYGNPTVRTLEEAVAGLEGGAAATAFSSGMGAISAVLLEKLGSGDHVVAQSCLYGGTHALLEELAAKWGVAVTRLETDTAAEARAAMRPETRVLLLETIANPTTRVCDLPALSAEAAARGAATVVDNTFATPLLCRPIEHGADVVVHSTSKYLSGHGDAVGGIAVSARADQHEGLWSRAVNLGACADPFAAWLTLRGLQTLALRMERHCANALDLATRLAAHPGVERVHYPGLDDHPDRGTAGRLLDGAGGIVAVEPAGGRESGRRFAEALRLVALGPSLGDVRSLALHPASTSHAALGAAELAAAGIGGATVRISVGVEDAADLWADVEQALVQAGA
ncbi:trans-sulfuration enzyme family protein [Streptomonospora salina]|uniref:homocysteine desulfhydrase n=1 Tax=Streptomonospora salina TaxID=104205 RepID=A0A841EJN1_9ACTN|nr:aminotransferase class I/II-fold pyridoxal phosphate-dependent enzyme [Streptomonospora salina]MBB6000998.1 methionine-gamma-lyase [Streptomonospora salina]